MYEVLGQSLCPYCGKDIETITRYRSEEQEQVLNMEYRCSNCNYICIADCNETAMVIQLDCHEACMMLTTNDGIVIELDLLAPALPSQASLYNLPDGSKWVPVVVHPFNAPGLNKQWLAANSRNLANNPLEKENGR